MRYLLSLVLSFCFFQQTAAENSLSGVYLGSREGDPASLVENVSTIYGDYTEVEVDLTVTAPDSLILSRFYTSRDLPQTATFGGWRFNSHCFLFVQKDPKGKIRISGEEKFERTYVYVGNPDGSILTYVGWQNITNPMQHTLFQISTEDGTIGLSNNAKGNISGWTNLKNNQLYFNPKTNTFELILCSEGRRFYVKHPSSDFYSITHEILPSGNKIFYSFDKTGNLSQIKETNASEKKDLGWIKIHYGEDIHVETSDGQTIDYHFHQIADGHRLLTQVSRSNKPDLHYEYQLVDNRILLEKKRMPEGRFVQVGYYTEKENRYKVKSITTPYGLSETASTQFFYGKGYTEVYGSDKRKTLYRFNEELQLTSIEQYLTGSLYRVHKKSWGKKANAGNLISTSVEDHEGNVFYHKSFIYNENKGDIIEEREYGNITGADSSPLIIDKEGACNQDGNLKTYSYFSGKNTHGFFQKDSKGAGVKYWYKKGTNLLVKKFILNRGSDLEDETDKSEIKKRYFYGYNEDGVLIYTIVDDGHREEAKYTSDVTERLITYISPKQELPNVGAPEIVEQKYSDLDRNTEVLLTKTINRFNEFGQSIFQDVCDANQNHRYSLIKDYKRGLLISETDPLGTRTYYSYDANHNLVSENRSNSSLSIEYSYDLRNRLISRTEKDNSGPQFTSCFSYDSAGNKLSEIDRFGNEILYINDDLGRPIKITYPQTTNGLDLSKEATYSYTYDLFDNQIAVSDPQGRVLSKSYNVHGKSTKIHHYDGTYETLRYDSAGNLHYYGSRDGLIQTFEYDFMGRLDRFEQYSRNSRGSGSPSKATYSEYNTFHMISQVDGTGSNRKTTYTYDGAGRLLTQKQGSQKIEFAYDPLGRMYAVKKWKSSNTFTLEIKEYDLLNRVIEERTEDTKGLILTKSRYTYNDAGQLAQVIGYPQNEESILIQYEYDTFGRPCKVTNAARQTTAIAYDDFYVNEWGQKTRKRLLIDPVGMQVEEIYDTDDNLIKVTKKTASGQLLTQSEACYDERGNRVLERAVLISQGHPPKIHETEYSFNLGNQLQSVRRGKGTPGECNIRFEYNTYGELTTKYNPGFKNPIKFGYAQNGNLETISYREGKKEVYNEISYDSHQNIIRMDLDSSLKLSYSYDSQDLPVFETIKDGFGSYHIGYSYDGEGKIIALKLPDGTSIEYTYEGPFVKNITRLNAKSKELYSYQVTSRDLMGNILEEILPGLVGKRQQLWDESGRRIEIRTDFFSDRVLENGYDTSQNILKRETIFGKESHTKNYEYNALSQLTSEKGKTTHSYSYDSIGNRLQKDAFIYTNNDSNQLLEAEDASYTFHPNGNLATKTVKGKTWVYTSNPLNQIVSIESPDQNIISFTYDLNGRRINKRIEGKDKKIKTFRFFYIGSTEIGCIDEKGAITELKIPSDPNNPEAPSIAIEIKQESYVPLYDLQGNIACLLDHKKCKVVESYHYSAYGEEEIINENGRVVANSSIGNPWRYRAKRIDNEVGLIYFGYRYYDPKIGRWISLDLAGSIDGPNLYAFVHNNPIKYVDYFGFNSTLSENCGCTQHNHPGWQNAPSGCICVCGKDGLEVVPGYRSRIGSNIASALSGIGHGIIDFGIGSLHDLQTSAVYIGAAEIEMSLYEREQMIKAVEESQAQQMATVESWMMDLLSIDESDTVYHSFRSTTTTGLEIGSLIAGGYGAVKGVIGFSKLAKMPTQISKLAKKGVSVGRRAENINAGVSLTTRLRQLETIQQTAAKTRILPDGRIRYYKAERAAAYPGRTRGSAYVTEYNPATEQVRGWNECYDQFGNINRVHPKDINGQSLVSPHYPLIAQEIAP